MFLPLIKPDINKKDDHDVIFNQYVSNLNQKINLFLDSKNFSTHIIPINKEQI